MENYKESYRATFPVDQISKVMYEYNKKREENPTTNYLGNKAYGLDDLVKGGERVAADEVDSIEHQIGERERIKQRNVKFLEEKCQKLQELLNGTECMTYRLPGIINAVRSKLQAELIKVDLKIGEEYVNAFRDVQRLEEQKRKLLTEEKADAGWLQ